MISRSRLTGALLILLPVAACTEAGEWAGTITDSAGVAIVANPDEGMWTPGEGWTLEEEMRFGSPEGELEHQFGQIGFLAVGSDERIYVSDTQAQHVKVFSGGGQYIRTIGGSGGDGASGRYAHRRERWHFV